jgi:hypothetical protein
VTVILHLGAGIAITAADRVGRDGPGLNLAEREVIEAGLAFKKAPKKNRQPQKKKNPKVKPPETVGVSRDADKAPEKSKDKDKPPPPDFVDPSATLAKFRNIDIDEDVRDVGADPNERDDGSDEGSEWGTLEDAKGDPYVGELAGRIQKAWTRPTLDTGKGSVSGCVKLAENGHIVERKLDETSKNSTLNRSVEEALRKASNMAKPVPKHLLELLTRQGICFRFTPGD